MDFRWLLRFHADANPYTDPDTYTYTDTDTYTYTDAYPYSHTHANTDAHSRLCHLFGRHLVYLEPGRL